MQGETGKGVSECRELPIAIGTGRDGKGVSECRGKLERG